MTELPDIEPLLVFLQLWMTQYSQVQQVNVVVSLIDGAVLDVGCKRDAELN